MVLNAALPELLSRPLAQPEVVPLELSGPLTPAEDVLLGKLEWYRAGDETSERQWGDVLGILSTAPAFDFAYARHWAEEIGVLDLLERAVQESEMR